MILVYAYTAICNTIISAKHIIPEYLSFFEPLSEDLMTAYIRIGHIRNQSNHALPYGGESDSPFPREHDSSKLFTDISECIINSSGEREYSCLYNYQIDRNTIKDGEFIVEGHFGKPNIMSNSLKQRLMQYGVPQDELNRFLQKGAVTA